MTRSDAVQILADSARQALTRHAIDLAGRGLAAQQIHDSCSQYAARLVTWLRDSIADIDGAIADAAPPDQVVSLSDRRDAKTFERFQQDQRETMFRDCVDPDLVGEILESQAHAFKQSPAAFFERARDYKAPSQSDKYQDPGGDEKS